MSDDSSSRSSSPLSVLGSQADDSFVRAERQISSQEFLEAVLEDRREDVAKMIVQDERLVRSRDGSGASAILLATYHGLEEMCGVLLRSDVELDVFEAAAVGETEALGAHLSKRPAWLAETSGDGFSPLQLACYFGRLDAVTVMVDLLQATGAGLDAVAILSQAAVNPTRVQAIHSACACPDADLALEIVRRLVEAGAEIEVEQAGGFRPLHQAASSGRLALVEFLLAKGAQPAVESDLGKTPLDLAVNQGHTEVAEMLRPLVGELS